MIDWHMRTDLSLDLVVAVVDELHWVGVSEELVVGDDI
jgi:hypothetical protein